MKGRDILAFYNRNFSLSVLVQDNHEFLEGGTLDVTWETQKSLILEAEGLMRRDPNRAIRLDARSKTHAAPTPGGSPAPKTPAAAPAAPANKDNSAKPKKSCRIFYQHR